MRRIIFGFLTLLPAMHLSPAYAQTSTSIETIDQSLFHSEPVEEEPAAEKATPPAKPAAATATTTKPAVETPEPTPEYDTALLQGLKKVSAETSTLEAPIDMPTTFGTLTITVKKCVKSKPEEQPENSALILIQDHKPDEVPTTVFSGWMFSSSPAISALEHPVYDITMLDCITHKKPKVNP